MPSGIGVIIFMLHFRRLSIHPLGTSAFVLSCALLVLPLMQTRANRVERGVTHFLWGYAATEIVLVCCALIFLLCIAVAICIKLRKIRQIMMLIGGGGFILSIILLVSIGAHSLPGFTSTGRTALHIGAWLSLAGGYLAMQQGKEMLGAWKPLTQIYLPLLMLVFIFSGAFGHLGVLKELLGNRDRFVRELANHLFLSFSSAGMATVIGVPLGILAWRRRKSERIVFPVINAIQTIPSLALFGLIIAPLAYLSQRFGLLRAIGIKGIGNTPALIALTLYALLPIIQNTYSGLAHIPRQIIDAGRGMGMKKRQVWSYLEQPLSFPILFTGIRTATVQAIGNTTVAALIGAAGLGTFIFRGLGQAAVDLILLGIIPIVLIAITVNALFGVIINHMRIAGTEAHA